VRRAGSPGGARPVPGNLRTMRSTTLRSQRVLVSLGFVLVGVGGLPLLAYGSISAGDQDFFWIVTALGYGVLAWASSAWLGALSKRPEEASGMHRALRLFALACLLLGVAYLGLINEVIALHRHHTVGIRYQVISDALSLLGFAMAASGFWTTADAVGTEEPTSKDGTRESRQMEPTGPARAPLNTSDLG
jgi:hypothetical protein